MFALIRGFISLLGWTAMLLWVAYFFRDPLCEKLLDKWLEYETGFEVAIDRAHLSLEDTTLTLRGVEFFNPPDFPERRFLSIVNITVVWMPESLACGTLEIRRCSIDVDEIVLVKNGHGTMNIDAFKPLKPSRQILFSDLRGFVQFDKVDFSAKRTLVFGQESKGQPAFQSYAVNIRQKVLDKPENWSEIMRSIVEDMLSKTPHSTPVKRSGFRNAE